MNPSEIIDALGGTYRVAEMCEIRPPSVSEWRKNGIPRARMMFLRLARPEVFHQLESKPTNAAPANKASPIMAQRKKMQRK